MFNRNRKAARIVSFVIIIILVLAMVVPLLLSFN
jgi:predicted nucleic acid-binding Zn ribbon protein